MLKNEDGNGDNKLAWREILYYRHKYSLRGYARVRRESFKKKDAEMIEHIKQIEDEHAHFKMADMNGDGYLNSEEFAMFSNPWRYARMYASDIRRNIKMFDADKDGRLNFEEYLKLRKVDKKDAHDVEIKKRRFQKIDQNNDKKLDAEEMLASLKSTIERKAEVEGKHLMRETDTDKDGVLSIEEMRNKLNLMLGSDHDVQASRHQEL